MAEHTNTLRLILDGSQAKTEADAVNKKLDGIGTTGQAAGEKASAGMDGMSKAIAAAGASASSGMGRMLFEQRNLTDQIRRTEQAIQAESTSLDMMQRVSARSADAQALLSGKMVEAQKSITDLLLQKRALNDQASKLDKQIDSTSGQFDKMTTRISVGRGLLSGYDAAIEGVTRAMGGMQLKFAIAIGLVTNLLPLVFRLIGAERERLEINAKQAALNTALAVSTGAVVGATNNSVNAGATLTRTNADLVTSFRIIAAEQDSYQKNTTKLNVALAELAADTQRTIQMVDVGGGSFAAAGADIEGYKDKIGEANKALGESEQAMRPALDTLKLIQTAYNLNSEQIIKTAEDLHIFNANTVEGQKTATFFKEQLDKQAKGLDDLASALEKASKATKDFSIISKEAGINASLALNQIKTPAFEAQGTIQGVANALYTAQLGAIEAEKRFSNMGERVQFNRANLIAFDNAIRQYVVAQLVANGQMVNATNIAAGYAAAMRQAVAAMNLAGSASTIFGSNTEEAAKALADQAKQARAMDDAIKQLTKTRHAGAGAARSAALAENNLTRELKEARAALAGDSFSAREEKIKADVEAERKALSIKKQLNAKAQQELIELEKLRLQKVGVDRAEAEKRIQRDIERFEIEGIRSSIERKQREITLELAEKEDEIRKTFGMDKRGTELILQARQFAVLKYHRWKEEQEAQARERFRNEEMKMLDAVEAERMKREKKLLDNMANVLKQQVKRMADLRNQFDDRGPKTLGGFLAHEAEIRKADRLMKLYGRTVDDVRRAFGFASRNARVFQLQLQAIEKMSKGDVFGGLKDSLVAIGEEFVTGGGLAQAWSDAIIGAFDATMNGGAGFLESFGKLLLGGMLQIFGQMAIISGSYHVAEGIARMATVWDFAGGLKEFIAGTALVALGAAMGAAGSAIASSGRKGGGGSATGGGGGGTSSSGGGAGAGSPITERSKFSPGPELTGVERISAIDRRIRELDAVADRTKWPVIERFLRRQIELLEAERRALGAIGPSIAREISRVTRVPINASGLSTAQPRFTIENNFDTEGTARIVLGALEGAGVITVGSLDGRHRPAVKRKVKNMVK